MTGDLRTSRNELAHRNEELEQFAFLASHDLQQPLRTVSGFLQLLERQHGAALDGRAREYVERALAGTRDMARLIDDLLAYSRAGRDAPALVPVPLDEPWDAAVAQLGAAIEETGATVTRDALPVVAGDAGHLTQVFANLIGNAIKYRADAPPVVHAEAVAGDGVWEVAVEDNGLGIDAADHQRIFGMFRRVHSSQGIDGTGVGLAIVKKLVERGGGAIRVESARGAGSRFVLTLPAAAAPAVAERVGAAA
jgi:light-regulated signal transduction histidine kinase (bacteriophytochrome)